MNKPVVLIIRDGWGSNHHSDQDSYNAIKCAQTPISDKLTKECPRTEILACGLDVGLPEGVMGNSEVGHQNIGAGRVVDQEIVRIDKAFKDPAFHSPVLAEVFKRKRVHLLGLVSDAGVHSSLSHLLTLMELAKQADVEELYIHAITDGRDTSPMSALGYIEQIEVQCKSLGLGKIASVGGRYYVMDRDHRWERTQQAYEALTSLKGEVSESAAAVVKHYYEHPRSNSQVGDEFVPPQPITNASGDAVGPISGGDAVVFFNFRGDRPRQITQAFVDPDFVGFERAYHEVCFATLTEYKKGLCPRVIFPKQGHMPDILGEVVSRAGIKQFRCAETEKYPHVTFFFNDYREEPFKNEDWALIPSPKDVATYDLKPEMSAFEVAKATREAILSGKYGLIVVNFANPDMVGHTGSLEATIKAVEVTDVCVGQLLEAVDQVGGVAVITADHGNADQMRTAGGGAHTQHTLNPVEVVIYGKNCELRKTGRLADIAPTLLALMGLPHPPAMTGKSLIM